MCFVEGIIYTHLG